MKLFQHFLLLALVFILVSCATAPKMNNLGIGMTKQDIIKIMGQPQSTSAQGAVEYLLYELSPTDNAAFYGWTKTYFVRLVNGVVESYGRMGDFDSTKQNTIQMDINQNIEVQDKK